MGYGGYGINDVFAHALRHDYDHAMARLRQAVVEGWRIYLRHNPIPEPLHARSDFQELLDEVEADVGERRESARAMIDAGKLPNTSEAEPTERETGS